MSSTTWNKATVPASADTWNLIPDVSKALGSATLVIPVASQAERDGLAALAPGAALPIPTVVCRTDLPSFPLYVWDGTVWQPVRNSGGVGYLNVPSTGTGFSSGEFLIDAITNIPVIAGHKYEVTYRFDTVFTTQASCAFVLNLKTSLNTDTGSTGTAFGSPTLWSAPVSNSGQTSLVTEYFECSSTGSIRFSATTGRLTGTSLYNISTRRMLIKDVGYF